MDTTRDFQLTQTPACAAPMRMPKSGFTATLIGHVVWVIGGAKRGGQHLSKLNTKEMTWKNIQVLQDHEMRATFHGAALFEDKILLYGLHVKTGLKISRSNHVHELDTILHKVSPLDVVNRLESPRFMLNHVMEVFEQGKLLALFRPQSNTIGMPGRLFLLDLSTREWKQAETKGMVPRPNLGPTMSSCMAGSRLFVFEFMKGRSGSPISMIDLKEKHLVWEAFKCCDTFAGGFGTQLAYVGNRRIILYGGLEKYSTEVVILASVDKRAATCSRVSKTSRSAFNWIEFVVEGQMPPKRIRSRFVRAPRKILVLGGGQGDACNILCLTADNN